MATPDEPSTASAGADKTNSDDAGEYGARMADTSPVPVTVSGRDLPKEQLLEMYSDMVLQRRFEEGAARAYGQGRIHGFCHLYIGQEAISTGTKHARNADDPWISAYRIHAQALAAGMEPQAAMDELFGKASGCVEGVGGSMHLFDIEKGFYGGWGLVGQQVPTGAGIAFAQKYMNTGRVTVTFLGDGALHQGAIHETLNLASVWGLPVVFVVENNKYGMGTFVHRISALPELHMIADPYGIKHWSFDGMDALASYEAMKTAIDWSRENSKPVFLEAKCSRFRGHSMSDPGKYRTKEKLAEEKAQDPIPKLASVLVELGYATEEELKEIDKATKNEMKNVLNRAHKAPFPDESLIHKHVYEGGEHV